MDLSSYINRSTSQTNDRFEQIDTLVYLGYFYSFKRIEIETALTIKFENLATARVAVITLQHLLRFQRNIKFQLRKLYGFSPTTLDKAITMLLQAGLIQTVACKRKTNIGLYVSLTAYQITYIGKDVISGFDSLLERKVNPYP